MAYKSLLNIKRLSVTYVNTTVLRDFSLAMGRGEIVAMVGANGCGKSTVLKLVEALHRGNHQYLRQNMISHEGTIDLDPGVELASLPQDPCRHWSGTTDARPDYSLAATERRLREGFGLGDPGDDPDRLSDGQLQKLAVIRTLTAPADLYLLDEPTNYLDIDGITALEDALGELVKHGRSVLLVTHDRTLTDNIASRTVFITANGIYHCRGGYQAAWSLTTSDFQARRKQARDIKRRIGKLQQDVRRRFGWSAKKEKSKIGAGSAKPTIARQAKKMASRAQAVQKRVEREIADLAKSKPFIPKTLNLSFPDYEIRNREAFHLREVDFAYPATDGTSAASPLLRQIDLSAGTTDKICLMGGNGAGKTTLFKLILGELQPDQGERRRHPSMNIQHLPQGLRGYFDKECLLDNLRHCGHETTVRQYLGAALLRREKVTQPISKFSQGELMRAAIVRCILERAEFLLLDEPTSHLDIESIEVLESLLSAFKGGFLMISHDRAFVENVSDRLYLLEGKSLRLV
jgi:ATP-binding cassette subfamily F protein 3